MYENKLEIKSAHRLFSDLTDGSQKQYRREIDRKESKLEQASEIEAAPYKDKAELLLHFQEPL